VRACSLTSDGAQVISASDDRTVRAWDLATGRPIAALQDLPWATSVLAVSSDGRCVVSMRDHLTLDHLTLQVAQLARGNGLLRLDLEARLRPYMAVADERRVFVASVYGYVQVWDVATGATLACVQLNLGNPVTVCAVTADRTYAVAASFGLLTVWDLETSQCAMVHRGLRHGWYTALAAIPGVIVAGTDRGTIAVLDWPQL
jgi:WD40 repeat protein